ncbi:hypothetical protein HK101_007107, partial [Irineochytrium annulatum]
GATGKVDAVYLEVNGVGVAPGMDVIKANQSRLHPYLVSHLPSPPPSIILLRPPPPAAGISSRLFPLLSLERDPDTLVILAGASNTARLKGIAVKYRRGFVDALVRGVRANEGVSATFRCWGWKGSGGRAEDKR